jgi:hypothetical protein
LIVVAVIVVLTGSVVVGLFICEAVKDGQEDRPCSRVLASVAGPGWGSQRWPASSEHWSDCFVDEAAFLAS